MVSYTQANLTLSLGMYNISVWRQKAAEEFNFVNSTECTIWDLHDGVNPWRPWGGAMIILYCKTLKDNFY